MASSEWLLDLFLLVLYLGVGSFLFRARWPVGMFPVEPNPERERLIRTPRRRVAPTIRQRQRP